MADSPPRKLTERSTKIKTFGCQKGPYVVLLRSVHEKNKSGVAHRWVGQEGKAVADVRKPHINLFIYLPELSSLKSPTTYRILALSARPSPTCSTSTPALPHPPSPSPPPTAKWSLPNLALPHTSTTPLNPAVSL